MNSSGNDVRGIRGSEQDNVIQVCRYLIPWPLLRQPKKSSNFFFTEWCLPGGQIVPTPCTSILPPTRPSQLPYNEKNTFSWYFLDFWSPQEKSFKVCPSSGRNSGTSCESRNPEYPGNPVYLGYPASSDNTLGKSIGKSIGKSQPLDVNFWCFSVPGGLN